MPSLNYKILTFLVVISAALLWPTQCDAGFDNQTHFKLRKTSGIEVGVTSQAERVSSPFIFEQTDRVNEAVARARGNAAQSDVPISRRFSAKHALAFCDSAQDRSVKNRRFEFDVRSLVGSLSVDSGTQEIIMN